MKPTHSAYWLTVAVLLNLTSVANAQIESGTYLVGTSVGHFSLNDNSRPIRTLILQPALGRFIRTNLVVGLELPFQYAYLKEDMYINSNTKFGVSPFVRYYLGSNVTVKPFGSLSAGWRIDHDRLVSPADNYDDVQTDSGFLYGATAGVAFFLNPAVSFDVLANYTAFSKGLDFETQPGLSYGRRDILRIGFGFQVYLGNDKRERMLRCTY
ncbi:outer membrane protein [Salmonirosea aquatica]|uniref:Outer membrane beta-barrel protein n=1 Tax=Salmonirosea aquatica TaxID=2654236 RepID=A0A7C9FG32_9BACT|nr:hypothetical protein [Cytophagaceae bacterium SJW1-29]